VKNIILIGAANGIGEATCRNLSIENKVFAISKSKRPDHFNENVKYYQGDITNYERVNEILNDIFEIEKDIDGIIYNSGILIKEAFEYQSIENMRLQMEVNYFGLVNIIQRIVSKVDHHRPLHILYIGSMSGFQNSKRYSGLSAYGASKAAAHSLFQSLAEEFKQTEMRFNSLSFGAVKTEMLDKAHPNTSEYFDVEYAAAFIKNTLLEGFKLFNGQVIPISKASL